MDKSVEKVDNCPIRGRASAVLGVFAKAPVAGQVKTRLSPPLLPAQAAELYAVILDETIRRFSGQGFELVICYAGGEDYFTRRYPRVARRPQRGADLGERMSRGLQAFHAEGYAQAVLIGSDSPDLPLEYVEMAFSALQQNDVVIAPATDGGYVLIGERCHHPQLFEQMPWSGGELMRETENRLKADRISWQRLPEWEDIDDEDSLVRLLTRSPEGLTAQYAREHLNFLLSGRKGSA